MLTNRISKYCLIRNNKITINGSIDFEQEQTVDFQSFIRTAYKNYEINYPKFFKMDDLCKLAFITAEVLLKGETLNNRYESEEIGLIIANSNSSLDTDIKHHDTIKDRSNYFPSPSVFVYTLPNIMIGEISIKNKIQGENAFFIFEKFEPDFICNYVNSLLDTGKAGSCISGWVDYYSGRYESMLCLVEKESEQADGNLIFQSKNLKKAFNNEILEKWKN